MIVCTNCGHENPDDATFCASCNAFLEWSGARTPDPSMAADASSTPADPQPAATQSDPPASDTALPVEPPPPALVPPVEPSGPVAHDDHPVPPV
ncbi:MAG: zinc-ribbon domain-containing protein, partial [Candidatus Limnocylindrales bacterium]